MRCSLRKLVEIGLTGSPAETILLALFCFFLVGGGGSPRPDAYQY